MKRTLYIVLIFIMLTNISKSQTIFYGDRYPLKLEEFTSDSTLGLEVIAPISSSITSNPNIFRSGATISSTYSASQNLTLTNIPNQIQIDTNKEVGEIPFTTQINNGSLIYNIPIDIAQISGKISPNISLIYNNLAPKGIAGFGWNIGGLSSISITPHNFYYDGKVQSAQIYKDSPFQLDGMRLIKQIENSLEIHYKTEQGNIKVISYAPSGKHFFKILYPNGITSILGYPTETSPKLSYPITRTEDNLGNYIKIDYIQRNNISYPEKIEYGSKNIVNIGSIQFTYQITNNTKPVYIDEEEIKQDQILSQIKTFFGKNILKTYTLTYIQKGREDYLKEVRCSMEGQDLNPLIFFYGGDDDRGGNSIKGELRQGDLHTYPTFKANTIDNDKENNSHATVRKYGQIQGKGKLAIHAGKSPYGLTNTTGQWGSKFHEDDKIDIVDVQTESYFEIPVGNGFQDIFWGDTNGDGDDELIKVNYRPINSSDNHLDIYLYQNNRQTKHIYKKVSGAFKNAMHRSSYPRQFLVGNFKGEGKNELLSISSSDMPLNKKDKSIVTLIDLDSNDGNMDSFLYNENNLLSFNIFKDILFTLDFDGDGKTDVCLITDNGTYIYSYENNSFNEIYNFTDIKTSKLRHRQLLVGDVNGDGKTDFILQPDVNRYNMLKPHVVGDCMGCCIHGTPVSYPNNGEFEEYVCDYGKKYCRVWANKPEEKIYEHDAYDWLYYYSTGTKVINKIVKFKPNDSGNDRYTLQDVNGDGLPDLLVNSETTTHIEIDTYLNQNGRIDPEINNKLRIDLYKSLGKSSLLTMSDNLTSGSGYSRNGSSSITLFFEQSPICYSLLFTRNDARERMLTGSISSLGIINKYDYSPLSAYKNYKVNNTVLPLYYNKVYADLNVIRSSDTFFEGKKVQSASYSYEDGIINKHGLGFRGFIKISITDNIRKQTTEQTFDPINWATIKSISSPSSNIVFSYNSIVNADKTRQINLTRKQENNKLINTNVTSLYTHDLFGNILTESVDYGDNIRTLTTNIYNNYDTNTTYRLGELAQQTIKNERKGNIIIGKTLLDYNTLGQLLSKSTFYGDNKQSSSENRYEYHKENHNLVSYKEKTYTSDWLTKKYFYDDLDRVKLEVQVDTIDYKLHTSYFYNDVNLLDSVSDLKGNTTKYKYDNCRRLREITYPDGSLEKKNYIWISDIESPFSNNSIFIKEIVEASNSPTIETYTDLRGREVKSSQMQFDGSFLDIDTQYYLGLVKEKSNPYRRGTTPLWNLYEYDKYDRLTAISYSYKNGNTLQEAIREDVYEYGDGENTVSITSDNVRIKTTYDSTNKEIIVEDNAGIISYNYRADGQLDHIIAPNNIKTSFTYDKFGRQKTINDPSAGIKTYTYDDAGNISKEIDANNQAIQITYDKYNRITKKVADGNTTLFKYDINGLMLSVTESNGNSETYTYTKFGQPKTVRQKTVDNKWLESIYTYTKGLLLSTSYKSSESSDKFFATKNYIYKNGYLVETKLGSESIFRLDTENKQGLTSQITTGVLTRIYDYSIEGYPKSRIVKNGNIVIQDFSYQYNPKTGNLDWRKDNKLGKQEDFKYDELNRLINHGNNSTAYDLTGNIINHSSIGRLKYNILDKPYAVSDLQQTKQQKDLISLESHQEIEYNAIMRPVSISEGEYTTSIIYNHEGNRVKTQLKKGTNNQLTRYYIGNQYEIDQEVDGNKERLYLDGDAYSASSVYIKEDATWKIYYILRDQLGSITHITNNQGIIKEELSYDPWGRLRNPQSHQIYKKEVTPKLLLGRGYTGHEHLIHYGLINMNARLYDPALGRFLSPDPYVQAMYMSQNFNRYSYVLNNPLRYTDPNGEWIHIPIAGLIAGIVNWGVHGFEWDGNGAAAFGIGFGVGVIGAATLGVGLAAVGVSGASVLSLGGAATVAQSATASAFSYSVTAPILSEANHQTFGDPRISTKDYFVGMGTSVVLSGLTTGAGNVGKGSNFFSGRPNELSSIHSAQVRSIQEGLSKPMVAASNIDDVLAERLGLKSVESYLNQKIYNERLLDAAIKNGPQQVGKYTIDGTSQRIGNIYLKDIFYLKNPNNKGDIRGLINTFEKEALNSGAKQISIYGSTIREPRLNNPLLINRLGYNYHKWGDGFIMNKPLKP